MQHSERNQTQLTMARRAMSQNLCATGLFSGVINILMLTGPLFMLQVYDRVLTSQSVNTLVALAGLAAALYVFMALIDAARTRVLVAMGHRFEQRLAGVAFDTNLACAASAQNSRGDAIRDVEQIRNFLSGPGASALFDLPWIPVYLGLVFAMHAWLGLVGLVGAVVLLAVAIGTDVVVRRAVQAQSEQAVRRTRLAESGRRNAELVRAIGMQAHLRGAYEEVNDRFLGASARAANIVGLSSSVTKVIRLALQSGILALAAYLAIHHQVTAGVMVAASIIMARGLQPIETLVGSWRALVGAQRAWRHLSTALVADAGAERIALPDAKASLSVHGAVVAAPGGTVPVLKGIGFEMRAGEALAVIGPTGGGKSTLARALVGAWPAVKGAIQLDAVPLEQYRPQDLGRQVGYLPQDVELFDGTIAQNIARFDPQASDEAIIAAAKEAGVHELIAGLKGGYKAPVGERGSALSGGQRQRVALARALYDNPFLVVLDEPNANLDLAGEAALNGAILAAKARGAIVVVIAHRASVLGAVDKVLVVEEGQAADFGPRDEVMVRLRERNQAMAQPAPAQHGPIRVIRGAAQPAPAAPTAPPTGAELAATG